MDHDANKTALAAWQALYEDKKAWISAPADQQRAINNLAEALNADGVITDAELDDLKEQVDAAYQWGEEESLSPR